MSESSFRLTKVFDILKYKRYIANFRNFYDLCVKSFVAANTILKYSDIVILLY